MASSIPEVPRVLVVDLSHRFGGASARALGLLRGMPKGRATYVSMDGSPIADRARALGLDICTVGSNKSDPHIAGRLMRLVRDGGYDVIDTQNIQSKFWASVAAARTGTPLVSTLNSWYMNEHVGGMRGPLYQALEQATSLLTDLYIAVSPEIRDCLLETGVPDNAIILIPNAVEIDASRITGDGAWLRQTFGLPEQVRVACAVGRLVEAKGYHHLVAAMGRLAAEQPDLYCLIVGDGHLRAELESQIAELGLGERVRLLGFRQPDEVLSIVMSSDLFVMPSVTEGTPVALLEASALARPIIASRVGGIPSIITHDQEGWLVEPGDEEGLAHALATLSADPAKASRLGSAAQGRVQSEFSLRAQVAATHEAYRRAIERRQRGRG